MSRIQGISVETEVGLVSEKVKDSDKESRGQWTNQIEFFLSCLGYAVGLGNVWRFPYLCMRNGGGAFLIPYFLALFLCGMPLFCLEISIGQFSGLSPMHIFEICPLMKGLGYAMFIVSGLFCVYYNTIVCWILYYLIKSFTRRLPWSGCDNPWNTPLCLARGVILNESLTSLTNSTGCSGNISLSGTSDYLCLYNNETQETYNHIPSNQSLRWQSPAEEFWRYNLLQITEGIEHLGGLKWDLCGTFLLSWFILFCCICKGIKTSGKVVYVTATIPYVFITALLIRGVTLPGALEGIKYYIIPDWSKLLEFQVWTEATLQIFYSLGPSWGGIITMASYNRFHNNCIRDAITVPIVTCLSSFYAGFVIFSVIGFMAHLAKLPVKDVVASGPGLAFIAYPEAISHMPFAPVWAVCFFCMLLSVGLDSMFATIETLISSIVDAYPTYLRRYKVLFVAAFCGVSFLVGVPCVTRGGIYIFHLMDWYIAMPALVIALLEFGTLAWVYGSNRLYYDVELMTGSKPCLFWKISWTFVAPFLLMIVVIYSFVGLKTPTYGDYHYPLWALLIIWAIVATPIVPLPVCAVANVWKQEGSLIQRIRASMRPSARWAPADDTCRANYEFSGENSLSCVRGRKVVISEKSTETKVPLKEMT